MLKSAPYFPVADVAATAAEYGQLFGFATDYRAGSPPYGPMDQMAYGMRECAVRDSSGYVRGFGQTIAS
jgi:dTDP-4-dehydrorhamnose 3,5-epimerase-like enzyme